MEPLALACACFGVLIVTTRLPLVVAPQASVRFIRRWIESNAAVRTLGAVFAPLGIWLAASAWGLEGTAASLLGALGWWISAASSWLLLSPMSYRRVVESLLRSVEEAALRALGAIGVAMGLALVWVAFVIL